MASNLSLSGQKINPISLKNLKPDSISSGIKPGGSNMTRQKAVSYCQANQ
jgi:hypothetical protein